MQGKGAEGSQTRGRLNKKGVGKATKFLSPPTQGRVGVLCQWLLSKECGPRTKVLHFDGIHR